MRIEPFSGLLALDAGESLAADGGAFLGRNIDIIDYFLRLGAKAHRHDNAPALATPATAPTLSTAATGGTLPADLTLSVCYTLIDAGGGETLPAPIASIATRAAVEVPTDVPVVAVDYSAGLLLVNDYAYVVTLVDASGGETPPTAPVSVYREPGSPTAQIHLSGLAQIVADNPGAAGWRLYRSTAGGDFDFLAAGTADAYLDDGSVDCDCGQNPPALNSTGGTSTVTITVPAAAVAGAAGWRLYATPDGSFVTPSLIGATRPVADAGTPITISALALSEGAPPDVATSIGGAHQIDPDTELLDWHWKRPVATAGALPTAGNANGDVRVVLSDGSLRVWTGGAWQTITGSGGGGTLVWRGTWDAGSAYSTNDLVYLNGSTYRAAEARAIGDPAPPAAGDALWAPVALKGADGTGGAGGSLLDLWQGNWDGLLAYTAGDVVYHGGSSWLALVNIAAGSAGSPNPAPVEGATWAFVAKAGADGAAATPVPRALPVLGINGNFQDPALYANEQALGVQAYRLEVQGAGNLPSPGGLANTLTEAVEVLHAGGMKVLLLLNRYDIAWDDPWWETTAVALAPFCDLGVLEVANEPDVDGIGGRPSAMHRDAVGYGAMVQRVADALVAAGSPIKPLAAAGGTGIGGLDYDTTGAGNWSTASNGGGWIGDIQRQHPRLEPMLGGWVLHPYNIENTDPDGPQARIVNAQRFTDHGIWLTEGGRKADPADAAAEALKAATIDIYVDEFLLDPAQNVAAFFFYNEKDYSVFDPAGDNGFALVRQDGSNAPAWATYQAAAARVAAAKLAPEAPTPDLAEGWVFRDTFDKALPQHYVEDPAGAYWLDNGKLKVLTGDGVDKRILRRGVTLTDLRSVIKLTAGTTPDIGLMIRALDLDNHLMALVYVGAGSTNIAVYKRDAGVYSNVGGTVTAAMVPGKDYWVLTRALGNVITIQLYDVDPAIGLVENIAPLFEVTRTLTGADATKFGAGIAGGVGIRTQPAAGDTTYDDFTVWDLATPVTVGGPQGPKGDPGAAGANGLDGASFTFRGAFDSATTYAAKDVVTYAGSSYIATSAVAPSAPLPNVNPNWQTIALAGVKGDQGEPGTPGTGAGIDVIVDTAGADLPFRHKLAFSGAAVTADVLDANTVKVAVNAATPDQVKDTVKDTAPKATTWENIALAAGATPEPGHQTPQALVDAAGFTHLRGYIVDAGTGAAIVATLSALYRPEKVVKVAHAHDDGHVSSLIVDVDGAITVTRTGVPFFLDGVKFSSALGALGTNPVPVTPEPTITVDPTTPLRAQGNQEGGTAVGCVRGPGGFTGLYAHAGPVDLRFDVPTSAASIGFDATCTATYTILDGPDAGVTGSADVSISGDGAFTGASGDPVRGWHGDLTFIANSYAPAITGTPTVKLCITGHYFTVVT